MTDTYTSIDTSWLEEIKEDRERLRALPKEEKLENLASLANEQIELQKLINQQEAALASYKLRFREVSEGLLPELLKDMGVSSFTLSNGLKVTDKQFIDAKITDPGAFDWLENNGEGEIVKMNMSFMVRRTEKDMLQPLLDMASKMNVDVSLKENVHHMTLKAFIAEALRNGREIPLELFNTYVGHRVSIK